MLARIAGELYWLGRYLVRAENTARMLDGLFHSDLQAGPDEPDSVTFSWESLLVVMSAQEGGSSDRTGVAGREEVVSLLALEPENPVSILSCVLAARESAKRSRDTISSEMWESINTFRLGLERRDMSAALRTGPYSLYGYVKERCALFWGLAARTMLQDEARAFLMAGGRMEAAAMVLRMLRVALPPRAGETTEEDARQEGNALALLYAVGGQQAFMRSVPAAPNAGPVARFLLFERDFPDSVAGSVEDLRGALARADSSARGSPPVLRLGRVAADLEFRSQVDSAADSPVPAFREVQHELERVDTEIAERYFHFAAAGARGPR